MTRPLDSVRRPVTLEDAQRDRRDSGVRWSDVDQTMPVHIEINRTRNALFRLIAALDRRLSDQERRRRP